MRLHTYVHNNNTVAMWEWSGRFEVKWMGRRIVGELMREWGSDRSCDGGLEDSVFALQMPPPVWALF